MNNSYLTREEAVRQINLALGVSPQAQDKAQARAIIRQKLMETVRAQKTQENI